MQSTPPAHVPAGSSPVRHSIGTRGGLAAAWLALQLTRLLFLPVIGLGLAMAQGERRTAAKRRAGSGHRAAASDV